MALMIKKATKAQAKLRMALIGPAGAGKTWTALLLARELAGEGRVLVIDTERGSASKYADAFDFDVIELDRFHPQQSLEALALAETNGYAVCIVDSLSHAWSGRHGILDLVAQAKSDKAFTEGWRLASPLHHRLVDGLLQAPLHVIATLRSKMAYVLETNVQGKQVPRKVGLQPIQRSGWEYEFDLIADLDLEHTLTVSKTRCPALNGAVIPRPGPELAHTIKAWLSEGIPAPAPNAPARDGRPPDWPDKPALLEAIKQMLLQVAPGDTDDARARRLALLRDYFGCRGWQAVQALPAGILQEGHGELRRWESLHLRAQRVGMTEDEWRRRRAEIPYEALEELIAGKEQPRPAEAPEHQRASAA